MKHLVVGHQPEKVEFDDGTKRRKGEAFQKFDGLVFLIDVGMSRAIDDSRGALLHSKGATHHPRRSSSPTGGRSGSGLAPRSSGREDSHKLETFQMEPCG